MKSLEHHHPAAQGAISPSVVLSIGLALAALVAALPPPASAQIAGALDGTFGSAGTVGLAFGDRASYRDEAFAIAVDDDDKIVVAGYVGPPAERFAIARLTDTGSPDGTFGSGGKATVSFDDSGTTGKEDARARAMTIASDGRIVLAGQVLRSSNLDFAVARLLATGAPDTSFGTGGKVLTAFQATRDDRGNAVALQGDGKIVVVGSSLTSSSNLDVAVARYLVNGTLDTTFSGDGKLTLAIGSGHDEGFAVAIDGSGKLVLAGSAADGAASDMLIVRLQTNGALDTSFNATGSLRIPIGTGNAVANALVIQPDGKLLLAGSARVANDLELAVARVTSGGALDPTFGDGGIATTPVGDGVEGRALVLHTSGRFTVGGKATVGGTAQFVAAQYRSDGSLDPTFGTLGVVTFGVGDIADEGYGIAQQSDGRVVLAGRTTPAGTQRDFAIARLTFSRCGDGVKQGAEVCDSNDLGGATCCSLFCTIAAAGSECRPSSGACDLAEACNGSSVICPADGFKPGGTSCRAIQGSCDIAESCTGSGPQCPADVRMASGTLCRGALGDCDVAETCDGDVSCPSDQRASAGTPCRPAADLCDHVETCDGSAATCPADVAAATGTVCRTTSGDCDVAETCDGASFACPADAIASAGTTCRGAADACDVAETCDGNTVTCPADEHLPDGDLDGTCDAVDVCPLVSDPTQADHDDDGYGDACDVCTNGLVVTKPVLRIVGLSTAPGDDAVVLKGDLVFPGPRPPIDPIANGFRVQLQDAQGTVLFDAAVPGGAYSAATRTGWRVNFNKTYYLFRTPTAVGGLVNKVKMRVRTLTPNEVGLKITGRAADFTNVPDGAPLRVVIVVDPPGAAIGHCGERLFAGPPPEPVCTFPTPTPDGSFTEGDVFECR